MLGPIVIALLQAVSGEPDGAPAPAPAATGEIGGAGTQPAEPSAQVRRCRQQNITGSRVRRGLSCTTVNEDDERRRWSQRGLARIQNQGNQPGDNITDMPGPGGP